MLIRRLFGTNYKNLTKCELKPSLLHAITGCNGSGKTNLLELLPFVAKLITGSDSVRSELFSGGAPDEGGWVPMRLRNGPRETDAGTAESFEFEIECEIRVLEANWAVEYKLHFSPFSFEKVSDKGPTVLSQLKISKEFLAAKEVGKPGPKRILLERMPSGETIVSHFDSRAQVGFTSQDDLSVLKIIEIREPKGFHDKFPLIAAFREALIATDLMRLNASKLLDYSKPQANYNFVKSPGKVVDHFSLYQLLDLIKQNETAWVEFQNWVNVLCGISSIVLFEYKIPNKLNVAGADAAPYKFIFITQYERVITPAQLSTGHAMLLGIVTALYTFMNHNGAVLLEEPESYLHPRAIIDLLKLLRGKSGETSVLISTHSPILLNDLQPQEVSLMRETAAAGYFTVQPVAEIHEAVAALHRGIISFGDLLQTNFTTSDEEP